MTLAMKRDERLSLNNILNEGIISVEPECRERDRKKGKRT